MIGEAIETKNAIIKSTMLGLEDHGIFTFYLHLDYGGEGQGFGGYGMSRYDSVLREPIGVAFGAEAILAVLKTLEVDTWEKLPGTSCRVRAEHSKVHELGHYLKDRWLNLSELAAKFREAEEMAS